MSPPSLRNKWSLVTAVGLFASVVSASPDEKKLSRNPQSHITPSSGAAFIAQVDSSTLIGKVMVTYNG
jgi:hypothetical protein